MTATAAYPWLSRYLGTREGSQGHLEAGDSTALSRNEVEVAAKLPQYLYYL